MTTIEHKDYTHYIFITLGFSFGILKSKDGGWTSKGKKLLGFSKSDSGASYRFVVGKWMILIPNRIKL